MATRTFPPEIDITGTKEMWPQLDALTKTLKPGDVLQAPDDTTLRCDKPLTFDVPGVKWHWNGAQFKQTTVRPYGASRSDGVIAGGKRVRVGLPLPATVNWGYVSGPGIPPGTHIVLDADRKGGTMDRLCKDASGLPLTFTSKQDRGRCGFRISAKDFEQHDATWFGPHDDPVFTPFLLEAQHGVDFVGAVDGQLDGIDAVNMYADGIYYGANGTRKTSGVEAVNGKIINCARSGVVPIHAIDCSVRRYVIDQIGRTICNMEPPAADGYLERWALTDSILGSHGLTLWSSGGNPNAHVGATDFSRNCITKGAMILWLTVGAVGHYRGPYTIAGNHTSSKTAHGGTYPTRALICISHSLGATVVDNTGIILQAGRGMAVVRERTNLGPVVVHGNEQVGGIETGPWIAP